MIVFPILFVCFDQLIRAGRVLYSYPHRSELEKAGSMGCAEPNLFCFLLHQICPVFCQIFSPVLQCPVIVVNFMEML